MRTLRLTAVRTLIATAGLVAVPAASRAGPSECVVRGQTVSVEKLVVHPPGARPFEFGLDSAAVEATLPAVRGAPARLHVRGAIEFDATARNLWLTLASPVETGQLRMVKGAHVVDARGNKEAVTASVVLYADDVLEGEDKQPGETAGPVRLDCAALTLDWTAEDVEDPQARGDGTFWRPRRGGSRVQLRSRPDPRAPALEIAANGCDDCLAFERLEQKGEWFRLARPGEAALATGWMRRADLVQLPEGEGPGRAVSCHGGHGPGGAFRGSGGATKAYQGPARVAVGTPVSTRPGRGTWATVRAEDGFVVRHAEGESWVELTSIPGLVGIGYSAFVPVSAVVFPRDGKP